MAESLRHLRQLTGLKVWLCKNALGRGLEVCSANLYGPCPTNHVQAIQALDPCSQCSPIPTPKFEETGFCRCPLPLTGSGGLCLPPARGAAGATAVVVSLRELPQLAELKVIRGALLKHLGPCHTNHAPGEEGGKAVASALARLTELKELTFDVSWNQIGPGPRRALCSDPKKSKPVAWDGVYCSLCPQP